MITIPLSRERHDLTAREFASHVADSDLLLAQNHRATIPMLSDPAHAEVFDREAVRDPVLRSFAAGTTLLDATERRDLGGDKTFVDADTMAAISIVQLGHRKTTVLFGGLEMVIGPELE